MLINNKKLKKIKLWMNLSNAVNAVSWY